ncbi:breast cancer protein [Zalerion maritima]|uniref:Inclusion body clearance protein IML2 n=1 Tax=Zalerion maritima TaxID=339359 RepID=A0AAD5RJK5_9PEZI|nr:breast cancer protein [Zalerion maritima]
MARRLMSSFWGSGGNSASASRATSPDPPAADIAAQEMADIDEAMNAAGLVMNDDIEGAEARLKGGDSAFHLLALGVCTFMQSILGVEKEQMNEAGARLGQCCTKADADLYKTRWKTQKSHRLYAPGSEFKLVQAEANLMIAVVSVMQESLPGVIKGFWKMKTAFDTLQTLIKAQEEAFKKRREALEKNVGKETNGAAKAAEGRREDKMPGSVDDKEFAEYTTKDPSPRSSSSSEVFVDANTGIEPPSGTQTPAGKLAGPAMPASPVVDMLENPIDAFIYSATNMCFGILLLLISMIPPVFSGPLGMVGLRGDRDRGLKMLWQSTKFDNVNGAIAALVLLQYYNGQLAFGDILRTPRDLDEGSNDAHGWPEERCKALLASMRRRYPDSGLWKLEEARGYINTRRMKQGLEILKNNMNSKMMQVNALNAFELGLSSMFSREWMLMDDTFKQCMGLNSWSHALYLYIRACAELEMYRNAMARGDTEEAKKRKTEAQNHLEQAPKQAGKTSILARPMPFEIFVLHKIGKWEARAKKMGLDMADVIGVSPAGEMSFLWNGGKKMSMEELVDAESDLSWDRLTAPEDKKAEIMAEADEKGVRDVAVASLERERGRWTESREILNEVIKVDRNAFKGPFKDDYVLPSAYYELAVLAWFECCEGPKSVSSAAITTASTATTPLPSRSQTPAPPGTPGELNERAKELSLGVTAKSRPTTANGAPAAGFTRSSVETSNNATNGEKQGINPSRTVKEAEAYRKHKALECLGLLEKVGGWGGFILDARMGLRVQIGLENVRWLIAKKGWNA